MDSWFRYGYGRSIAYGSLGWTSVNAVPGMLDIPKRMIFCRSKNTVRPKFSISECSSWNVGHPQTNDQFWAAATVRKSSDQSDHVLQQMSPYLVKQRLALNQVNYGKIRPEKGSSHKQARGANYGNTTGYCNVTFTIPLQLGSPRVLSTRFPTWS